MLHPSYSDLMKVVNSEVEPGEAPVVNSRYSIVMATSKRARQIIAGEEPMVDGKGKKPLSVAVEELNQGKIKILSEEDGLEEANLETGAEAETDNMELEM
ncbi:MAG TPA: DNA-directed RNA polymerase subunit omega [Lachnospiraceae bacterium]|nr:DNA-directed RNA polymerase subunit omega [Lachnospiraceae bacterium]